MLYHTGIYTNKKEEFIFEAQPYNEDIDIRKIAEIQKFYEKNKYIPEQYIQDLLDYITYNARKNILNNIESPLYSSFKGTCARAQTINDQLLEKLGLKKILFNVGDVIGKAKIHSLVCVQIPTKKNNEIVNKKYILDPTFRQFCIKEENRYERYNEEPRFAVKMSCPHPGYFLNLTESGKDFANNLINLGYFEATEKNLKIYFDSFVLYTTPKEEYKDINLVGRLSTTSKTGNEYWNQIIKNKEKPINLDTKIQTPKEIVNKEDKKILNKLKSKLIRKKELDLLLSYESIWKEELSNNKKI